MIFAGTIAAPAKQCTRIVRVRISRNFSIQSGSFGTEVICMFFQPCRPPFAFHRSPKQIAVLAVHVIALHYALEKYPQIKSFPVGSKIDTELIAGGIIADYFQVAVVFYGSCAFSNSGFTIQIPVHDVSCIPFRTKRLSAHGCQMRVHFRLSFGDAYGFVSPDFSNFASRYIRPDRIGCIAGIAFDSGFCIRQQKFGSISQSVFQPVVPADFQFPSGGFQIAVICSRRTDAQYIGKFGSRTYHIVGVTGKQIERTFQAIFEQTIVKSHVP